MSTGGGGGPGDRPDMFGPHERSGVVRALLLVVGAVVVGAILMPSGTRPALRAATATVATPTTSSPTTAPSRSQSTTTTTLPASSAASAIHVLVANGTNTNGAATAVSSFLSGKGFSTLTPVDALTVVRASQIYAIARAASDAQAVARALGLGASSIEPAGVPVPVSSTAGSNVVVVVGPDLQSRS
jgi:hypothetical protein